ncbi:exopolyphosphatase [Mycena belliarum]|uniref:Exopolyphosphatase n=1 Tax=Mycena belliarum TaxID=1033014 RepID=A0AAD6UCR8_9AGAR|nr:exopolyphosphatase [Mycena belliae]
MSATAAVNTVKPSALRRLSTALAGKLPLGKPAPAPPPVASEKEDEGKGEDGAGALATFLEEAKERYLCDVRATPSRGGEWTVVMGNEAGDLDSLASAIAYAYLLSHPPSHPPTSPRQAIPLIQTAPADLHLRAENLHALRLAGVPSPATTLLSSFDPLLHGLSPFPSRDFALVDHNRLGAAFTAGNPGARVLAVLDHHADEGLHADAQPRVVAPAGSCASHVANAFPNGADADADAPMPRALATLLLGAILIDTGGLRAGGKALAADHAAAAFLLPLSTLAPAVSASTLARARHPNTSTPDPDTPNPNSDTPNPNPNTPNPDTDTPNTPDTRGLAAVPAVARLAAELERTKADVGHLGAWDLLRRDYKEYACLVPVDTNGALPVNTTANGTVAVKAGLATVPVRLEAFAFAGKEGKEGRSEGGKEGEGEGDLEREAARWMAARGLGVLGVLTSFRAPSKTKFGLGGKMKLKVGKGKKKATEKKDGKEGKGKHKREMAWFVRRAGLGGAPLDAVAARLWAGLEGSAELRVRPHKIGKTMKIGLKIGAGGAVEVVDVEREGDGMRVRVYKQGNAGATRKATAPLLVGILEGTAASKEPGGGRVNA